MMGRWILVELLAHSHAGSFGCISPGVKVLLLSQNNRGEFNFIYKRNSVLVAACQTFSGLYSTEEIVSVSSVDCTD